LKLLRGKRQGPYAELVRHFITKICNIQRQRDTNVLTYKRKMRQSVRK